MATTDAKPGFRLPWSSDRSESAETGDAMSDTNAPGADPRVPSHPVQELETTEMIDAAPATTDHEAAVDAPSADTTSTPDAPAKGATSTAAAAPAARKPNKFMADLTKAMQAAAEGARADTLERLNGEAKATIERIHADSANEATDLRKQADDDVAAVREWSKAEIARIREETDERIVHRKERLEREIESHAAAIEARIERVQGRVTAFEAEMGAFFERLLAEDDPTRFAAMAESLPEPPPFDSDEPYVATFVAAPVEDAVEAVTDAPAEVEPTSPEPEAEPEVVAEVEPEADVVAEAAAQPADNGPWTDESGPLVPAAEASPADAPSADAAPDLFSIGADEAPAEADDPRLAMLGVSPDFAAAEAEAATFDATEDGSEAPVPELADEAIAARIAGLVPDADSAATGATTTRVSVVGLVSVASIAGFKRHLSRANGVQSVGVSSGPDGEFVFTVEHDASVPLRDVVPTLPGFSARVTAEEDGQLTVAAQDPEAES